MVLSTKSSFSGISPSCPAPAGLFCGPRQEPFSLPRLSRVRGFFWTATRDSAQPMNCNTTVLLFRASQYHARLYKGVRVPTKTFFENLLAYAKNLLTISLAYAKKDLPTGNSPEGKRARRGASSRMKSQRGAAGTGGKAKAGGREQHSVAAAGREASRRGFTPLEPTTTRMKRMSHLGSGTRKGLTSYARARLPGDAP